MQINEFTLIDFKKNEQDNYHTENAVELVKMFGKPDEQDDMAEIEMNHNRRGYITPPEQKQRDMYINKYLPYLEAQVESVNEGECGPGEYYCMEDQKCKPIPAGFTVRDDGYLIKEGMPDGADLLAGIYGTHHGGMLHMARVDGKEYQLHMVKKQGNKLSTTNNPRQMQFIYILPRGHVKKATMIELSPRELIDFARSKDTMKVGEIKINDSDKIFNECKITELAEKQIMFVPSRMGTASLRNRSGMDAYNKFKLKKSPQVKVIPTMGMKMKKAVGEAEPGSKEELDQMMKKKEELQKKLFDLQFKMYLEKQKKQDKKTSTDPADPKTIKMFTDDMSKRKNDPLRRLPAPKMPNRPDFDPEDYLDRSPAPVKPADPNFDPKDYMVKPFFKLPKNMDPKKFTQKLRDMNETISRVNSLMEKSIPNDKSKWSYAKSQAKKKFKVYPSAYANAWAAKKYKELGGTWRKGK